MKTQIQVFWWSVILLCTACTNQDSVIDGTLASDRYHDEWVYWVPFTGASATTVDSARINKNSFRLVVSPHNVNKTGIIRVRHQLRLGLQDILVFTEPGNIHVHLDSVSRSTGTPLNETLQNWKDRKRTHDAEISALRRKRRAAEPNDENAIKEEIENASAAYRDDIFQIVLENKDNEAGKLIYSLNKASFTPEQIQEIEIEN